MNFYQRMGILPLKKRINRDKCSFTTKQRMFGVFAIDEILRYRGTRFPGSRTLCHPAMCYLFRVLYCAAAAIISFHVVQDPEKWWISRLVTICKFLSCIPAFTRDICKLKKLGPCCSSQCKTCTKSKMSLNAELQNSTAGMRTENRLIKTSFCRSEREVLIFRKVSQPENIHHWP